MLTADEFEDAGVVATGCTFEPAGRRVMRAFAEPVTVRSLIHAAKD